MKNILVLGYYWKSNLGDMYFMHAFQVLFPAYHFTFVDKITIGDLLNQDAVFVGGGSFLNQPLNISSDATDELKKLPIFYLGVGAETKIDDTHMELMSIAKLIAIRTPDYLPCIKNINSNSMSISDIVYSLNSYISPFVRQPKSVLVLPNILVTPSWNDPHWKHAAWSHFKVEFAQFLDGLIDQLYTIHFMAMSYDNKVNDNFAAAEIINSMSNRNSTYLHNATDLSFEKTSAYVGQHSFVITQRFHGAILADMVGTPCLSVYHHDKLKVSTLLGDNISYYGFVKDQCRHKFDELIKQQTIRTSINNRVFDAMVKKVEEILG